MGMTVKLRAAMATLPGYVPGRAVPGAIKLASNETPLPPLPHVVDLDAMAEHLTEKTRLIFVCNPNNPTGTVVHADELRRFLAAVPDDVVVVIDEAYHEFVTDAGVLDALTLLDEHPNVIVLRT